MVISGVVFNIFFFSVQRLANLFQIISLRRGARIWTRDSTCHRLPSEEDVSLYRKLTSGLIISKRKWNNHCKSLCLNIKEKVVQPIRTDRAGEWERVCVDEREREWLDSPVWARTRANARKKKRDNENLGLCVCPLMRVLKRGWVCVIKNE